MKIEIGKTYIVKKDIFSFKRGELWLLADKGYQAYYGEHNFVLRDHSDEDIKIYSHLEEYFEEK